MSVAEMPQAKKPEFKTPDVKAGMTVLWYAHADKTTVPHVALVQTNDGRGGLTLKVERHNAPDRDLRFGVRHLDDPFYQDHQEAARQSGAWDFTERDKELNALLADLRGTTDKKAK